MRCGEGNCNGPLWSNAYSSFSASPSSQLESFVFGIYIIKCHFICNTAQELRISIFSTSFFGTHNSSVSVVVFYSPVFSSKYSFPLFYFYTIYWTKHRMCCGYSCSTQAIHFWQFCTLCGIFLLSTSSSHFQTAGIRKVLDSHVHPFAG